MRLCPASRGNCGTEVTHREAGTHLYHGMCFKCSKTPADIQIPPNCLGEHNDYVYGEILGMSKEEIAQLKEEQGMLEGRYGPGVQKSMKMLVEYGEAFGAEKMARHRHGRDYARHSHGR